MALNTPPSITGRLLLATVISLPLFFAATGYAIDRAHREGLIESEHSQLETLFYALLGAIDVEQGWPRAGERLKEPRFWQLNSGLIGLIRAADSSILWMSRSASGAGLDALPPSGSEVFESGSAVFNTAIIEGQPWFRYQYSILWEDDDGTEFPMVVELLSSQQNFLREQTRFRRSLALWLSAAALIIFGLQIVMTRWGLLPLRALAGDLKRLQQGDSTRLEQQYPTELRGVTSNLNSLLLRESRQRQRYKNTLGDLAHSLKTPLSVLRNEAANSSADSTELEQIERMQNIIDYQLKRAVGSGQQHLGERCPAQATLKRLADTFAKVYRDKHLDIRIEVPEQTKLKMAEDDFMELAGNLLDNACKAARKSVYVSAGPHSAGLLQLLIEDDGPGMDGDTAARLSMRGQRGDQYGSGHGLGLAIAHDIVDSHDGRLSFSQSALGGACAQLTLPA